jgi:hypothetical protein
MMENSFCRGCELTGCVKRPIHELFKIYRLAFPHHRKASDIRIESIACA